MQDLSEWKACKPPTIKNLKGHYAFLQHFDQKTHGCALWNALGGLETNQLLRYFPDGPFANANEFSNWLQTQNESGTFYTMVISSLNGEKEAGHSDGQNSGNISGMANYMRITPEHGSIEVGAVAHGPRMARTPIATEAHYLLASYIFDELGYRRYEWKLNNENEASHKAALRLGFVFEGTFRNHMVAKGKNRDTAWYSMLDSEWPHIKAAMQHWLRSENFDKQGQQIKKLEEIREELA